MTTTEAAKSKQGDKCIYPFVPGVQLKAVLQCTEGRLLNYRLGFTDTLMLLNGITHMRLIAINPHTHTVGYISLLYNNQHTFT